MTRIASVLKQGFYPAPPAAIAGIFRHLKIPDPPPDQKFKPEDVNVLDPCAGEAKALAQLAEGLGVSKDNIFAIALNASRAARIALELKSMLSRCYTLDCTCCILTATSVDLDSIVEFGLKNGVIAITTDAA
jgi:Uncharacterised methyltransferase family (DUF6094)